MQFLTPQQKHIFLNFLIEHPTPPSPTPQKKNKIGIQGNNPHIFPLRPKLKKEIFRNLKILKFSMPKR